MLSNTFFKDILPVIEQNGFDIVELIDEKHSGHVLFKVFIDKEGGVTVDDCKKVTHIIHDELFKQDTSWIDYKLEVSSPGADRPLSTVKDFERNVLREIQVTFCGDKGNEEFEGKLISADEHRLVVENKKNSRTIPFEAVVKGRVVLPW